MIHARGGLFVFKMRPMTNVTRWLILLLSKTPFSITKISVIHERNVHMIRRIYQNQSEYSIAFHTISFIGSQTRDWCVSVRNNKDRTSNKT